MGIVDGSEINECPVSYIHPKATELVRIGARTKHAHNYCGATTAPLEEMDAWMVDVFQTLEVEHIKEHNAISEAERDK